MGQFLVQEVGWDSSKPGYNGLVDVAKRLLVQYRTGEETERATVQLMLTLKKFMYSGVLVTC